MNPIIDHLLHSGELVAFLLVAWRVIHRLNRDESLQRDYPPHRHVNGSILYPPDLKPGVIERANGAASGGVS